jgi:hypothetical protein
VPPAQPSTTQSVALIQSSRAFFFVNLHRDEELWRMAGPLSFTRQSLFTTGKGAPMNSSSFRLAFTSIPTLTLLSFKSLSHFFFGRSINNSFDLEYDEALFCFTPTPTFSLAGCSLVLSISVAYLPYKSPMGPQPVTWGHLQTLQDLIDDWAIGPDGRLWWGDKGDIVIDGYHQGQPLRKAGTSEIPCDLMLVRQDTLCICF